MEFQSFLNVNFMLM